MQYEIWVFSYSNNMILIQCRQKRIVDAIFKIFVSKMNEFCDLVLIQMRGIADEKCEVFLSKRSELMMNADLLLIEVIKMMVNDIL